MIEGQQRAETLKCGLKNRHIQLIALGGAIGTGLFLGIAQTIQMAGPSVILGYAIGGVIAFLIMRQLSEMVVEEAMAGLLATSPTNIGVISPVSPPAGIIGYCMFWWR